MRCHRQRKASPMIEGQRYANFPVEFDRRFRIDFGKLVEVIRNSRQLQQTKFYGFEPLALGRPYETRVSRWTAFPGTSTTKRRRWMER